MMTATQSQLTKAAFEIQNFAHPIRVGILLTLTDGPMGVTALRQAMADSGLEPVSSAQGLAYHVTLLRHGGAVELVRDGKTTIYRLTDKGRALADLISQIKPC